MKKIRCDSVSVFAVLWTLILFSQYSFAAEQSSITNTIKQIYIDTKIGAISYVLVENGQVVEAGGFGQYSLHNKTPITENSLFRVGSITKTFTAIAIMQQVEKGNLKLTQTIKSILEHIPLSNPYKNNPVTVEMLLEHTSGLQDLNRKEFNYPKPLSLKNAFKVAPSARRVITPPGYHYNYTNVAAGYLVRAIEVINKVDYDDWFDTEILDKMAMNNSSLKWSKLLQDRLVTGYDSDLETEIPYWHTLFRPFGGLNTTAMDMSKLLTMLTADRDSSWKQILSAESVNRMETPTTSLGARAGLKAGYGLAIRNTIFKGHRIYGHGGDGDGYLAQFSYSKESGRGYFYVINAFRADIDRHFSNALNNWLIEKTDSRFSVDEEHRLSVIERKLVIGDYIKVTSRFPRNSVPSTETLSISLNNGVFSICSNHQQQCKMLIPTSNQLFKLEGEHQPSIAIKKALDNKIYLQWKYGNFAKIK